jgi:hypothetical protein
MALDAEGIARALADSRVGSVRCSSLQGLASQVAEFQAVFENITQQFMTEIINIINTGGGATTPVYIIRALVDKTGGVTSADTTFNFDGASDVFTHSGLPSGVTSGVAQNVELRPFQDNEVVILTSFGSDIWLADKIERDVNVIRANVDGAVTTASGTFDFDNATVLLGFGPTGGMGTAINEPRVALGDNEVVVLFQAQDDSWQILQDDDDLGGGGSGTTYDSGFGIDGSQFLSATISLDIQPATNFNDDTGVVQIPGHDSGEFMWFETIVCNPSP